MYYRIDNNNMIIVYNFSFSKYFIKFSQFLLFIISKLYFFDFLFITKQNKLIAK